MATTKTDSKVEANKKVAAETRTAAKKTASKARSSVVPSKFMATRTVTINEGTDQEFDVTFQFPGTAAASNLRDNCMNPYGMINRTAFMTEAIKPNTGIIVNPQIKSLAFFDTHDGYDELTNQAINFLADMLD